MMRQDKMNKKELEKIKQKALAAVPLSCQS